MPFRLPTFNLLCNVGHGGTGIADWPGDRFLAGPRLVNQACALVYGRRVNLGTSAGSDFEGMPALAMNLLLPPLTDIRSVQSVDLKFDSVEVPAGSGRWYGVAAVDDIGKGYPNEHRTAVIQAQFGTWAVPYP